MPIYITKIKVSTYQEPQRIFATKRSALKYIQSFIGLNDTSISIEQWSVANSGVYRFNKNVYNNEEL